MFKKLKRVKTLFIKRIASGNQSTKEAFFFTNYIGFGDKKITNLSGSVSFNQAVIMNITKAESSHKKKLKL